MHDSRIINYNLKRHRLSDKCTKNQQQVWLSVCVYVFSYSKERLFILSRSFFFLRATRKINLNAQTINNNWINETAWFLISNMIMHDDERLRIQSDFHKKCHTLSTESLLLCPLPLCSVHPFPFETFFTLNCTQSSMHNSFPIENDFICCALHLLPPFFA